MRPFHRNAIATVLLLIPLHGCPRSGDPTTGPGGTGVKPRVWNIRSYSESVPFTSIARLSNMVYAGTPSGVIRFNERNGEFVRLTSKEGMTGNNVFAVAGNPTSGLWVATEAGLSRFNDGVWTNFPLGKPPGEAVSAMVATDWGVWAGGPQGLGRLRDGKWKGYLPGARVTHLLPDLDGSGVWVGTGGEGIHQWDGKKLKFVNHSPAKGQPLRHVYGMTFSSSGAVIAVGRGEGGYGVVLYDGQYWTTYRPKPQGRIHWVQLVANHVLLAYQDRILVMRRVKQGEHTVPAGPVALERSIDRNAPSNYPAPKFYTEPLDRWLPPEATIVVGHTSGALIGTRTAGLVRFDGTRAKWFRTRDLLGVAEKLRMACKGGACYLAGWRGRAFRLDGTSVQPVKVAESGVRVLAFVDDGAGGVMALLAPGGRKLVLSRLIGDKWVKEREYSVTIPSGRVEVSFARRSPTGDFWVGLGYRESGSDVLPWGMAVLKPSGSVHYHRNSVLPDEKRAQGSLALPNDARDVEFLNDGTIMVATGAGVCQVKGDRVKLFTENEGLLSEITYKVLRSPKGELIAATHGGLGRYNGKEWLFDFDETSTSALRTATRALLVAGDVMWVGTRRGLMRIQNGKQQVFNADDGLAADEIYDIRRDSLGRLWVLTAGGLSIMTPGAAKKK